MLLLSNVSNLTQVAIISQSLALLLCCVSSWTEYAKIVDAVFSKMGTLLQKWLVSKPCLKENLTCIENYMCGTFAVDMNSGEGNVLNVQLFLLQQVSETIPSVNL